MAHETQWETDGVYRKFTGHVTGDEIFESNLRINDNPLFHDARYSIDDFSDVESHEVNPSHVHAYATTDKVVSQAKGKLKVALVTDKKDHLPLAQQYQQLMQGELYQCEIFADINSARHWLK